MSRPGLPLENGRLAYPFPRVTAMGTCAEYEVLREKCPVAPVTGPYGRRAWLLTRFWDVCLALSDPRFSRAAMFARPAAAEADRMARDDAGVLLNTDPPEHDRLRRLAAKFLSARRVESLRPQIAQLAAQLADDLRASSSPAEFNTVFAEPLSRGTLGFLLVSLLDVPPGDQEWVRAACGTLLRATGRLPTAKERADALRVIHAYLTGLLNTRPPLAGRDIVSEALARRAAGQPVSAAEVIAVILNILLGGHAAVVSALGYSIVTLLSERGQWQRLAADPSCAGVLAEEVLRYSSPGERGLMRIALTDAELGGHVVSAGSVVIPGIAAANRDPARFAAPGEFRPGRPDGGHLSFGYGAHACLGMALARLELRVALITLAEWFPRMTLARPLPWLTRTHTSFPTSPIGHIPLLTRSAPSGGKA